ncbi:unnamed protein product [Mytilus edulis]|uniref:Uncharacterized protein n=1 Tax=Mytilus edulis TaxID=6550 RepID=A0A8S3T4P9_MYTED|nr:unnamed protein product [Mytilus edulis]
MSALEKYLKEIYYIPSNPASFSGPDKLYNYIQKDGQFKISKYKIRKWLQSQEPYSLQRPLRRPQNRTEIVVAGIDDQWSADLMDMHYRHGTCRSEKGNEEAIRLSTYFSRPHSGMLKKQYHFRFKLGDRVRLTYLRNIFSREYDEKWTGEVFTISGRFWRSMTPLYRIKDYHGKEISGSYYQFELQRINVKDNSLWKIEKVIKTKGRGPYKQYYIKWLKNSWVKASDVKDFQSH